MLALILCFIFMIVEVTGGVLANRWTIELMTSSAISDSLPPVCFRSILSQTNGNLCSNRHALLDAIVQYLSA